MHKAYANAYERNLRGAGYGLCILLAASTNVNATVLEYDKDGQLSVAETIPDDLRSQPTRPVSSSAELVALTREVALTYSGSVGVRRAGLDALTFVEVFEALIKAESAFDPNAVSPKGAKGLGQLMPGTATDMGVSNPFDPKSNLIGSAKYFTSQLSEFGALDLALAAYNAGPERVKQHKGVPPFAETKSYIAAILKDAGLTPKEQEPAVVRPVSAPNSKEQPLIGDVSVWEF